MFKRYGWCPGEKHFKTLLKTKWLIHGLFLDDWFVVFLCKIRDKMERKWGKITKGSALESGWIWKCSLYSSSPYKIWEKITFDLIVHFYCNMIGKNSYFTRKSLFSIWLNIRKLQIGHLKKRPRKNYFVFDEFWSVLRCFWPGY